MKRSMVKITALCLCASLALGGLGVYALAAGEAPAGASEEPRQLSAAAETADAVKDETVYILAESDGAVQKIIVSDWLKNPMGSASLRDPFPAENVENVKGGETYTAGSGDALVWDAQGNDIYCQGTSGKELPVDLRVSYQLDGQSVSPQELAGKSGRVTIRFDYTNRQYEEVDIDGKTEKIYVPFAVLTGMALDNDVFSNVEVSSGRIYSDGDRTAVIGLAFPGLEENLNVDPEKLEIPSYVEVTADVENFALANTVTIASSGLFRELDMEKLDGTGDLEDSLDGLTDAMDQLMDGSSRLYDGLCELLDKSGTLVDGINQLAEGAGALQKGAEDLRAGASQLHGGASQLQTGLEALSENNGQLCGGARQVFETLLASGSAQLAAAGLELPALTVENYGKVLDGVIAAMPQGAEPVAALKASLDSYNAFYQGLLSYTEGVAEAAAGSRNLTAGTSGLLEGAGQLCAGAGQAADGAKALQAGTPALVEGIVQLRDGAGELSSGLEEFNEQGIQKLIDAVDGDLAGLLERLKATANAAERYRSFTGGDSADGQVKFIYRTEAIELAE